MYTTYIIFEVSAVYFSSDNLLKIESFNLDEV